MAKRVYFFGDGRADGHAGMKTLLGGKGANLAEMTGLGLPVPPGFTISTDVCNAYHAGGGKLPAGLMDEVGKHLRKLERILDRGFGDPKRPLLVSVRSGAAQSMPGMMDTVLNLGLNDRTVEGMAQLSGNPRFAWDSYRRFLQMYGDVVLGMKPESKTDEDPFEAILERRKRKAGVSQDMDLSEGDLEAIAAEFKALIEKRSGKRFPQSPIKQLEGALRAVFGSWMNDRALAYRRINKIPEGGGTAVNVQSMVFGNMGDDCGTGVAFSRDPATGENRFYGEFLFNAQGEDVVAGTRTPQPIAELAQHMPGPAAQLEAHALKLENHYRDMQDLEFTIQNGKLWMLQTRSGKRTGLASVRIATEMVDEKLITSEEALERVEPAHLQQLLVPVFEPAAKKRAVNDEDRCIAKGLNAGPGAATGRVVFHADDAVAWAAKGHPVILVRDETSPEDISGMEAAGGILTARGGMTSHAAVVARQMGKVCVAGCSALEVDYKRAKATAGGKTVKEGDWLSLDGTTGEVILGEIQTRPSEVQQALAEGSRSAKQSRTYRDYERVMRWADRARRLRVRTNADQPDQAALAVAFGAEGIGLCRTEHMFFGEGKIEKVQEMIVAETAVDRARALKKLLPLQRRDFEGIFRAMAGRPVTVRTLDPPLHEFLPHDGPDARKVARALGIPVKALEARVAQLHEQNPMLGHRGCRLGIVYPEITEMQTRALFEAACNVKKKGGKVAPEIMIPLVGHVNELRAQAKVVRRVASEVMKAKGVRVRYLLGTMIEVPRAALTAEEIADVAEFFSFGTNDLTQTTFGLSRDDAGVFLGTYLEQEILPADPFQTLDQRGVGRLVELAVAGGRGARPDIKLGICGEHGGDPDSIDFCHRIGLAYVSCSPNRVPIARLAAARAALAHPDPKAKKKTPRKKAAAKRPRTARNVSRKAKR